MEDSCLVRINTQPQPISANILSALTQRIPKTAMFNCNRSEILVCQSRWRRMLSSVVGKWLVSRKRWNDNFAAVTTRQHNAEYGNKVGWLSRKLICWIRFSTARQMELIFVFSEKTNKKYCSARKSRRVKVFQRPSRSCESAIRCLMFTLHFYSSRVQCFLIFLNQS